MSLNDAERVRTRRELQRNLELSGLTTSQVAADLGMSLHRMEDTFALGGQSDPADVWQLRDYLEQVVRDVGGQPATFTVLTEQSRAAARVWFTLRPAPRRDAS